MTSHDEPLALRNFSCVVDAEKVAWLAIHCPDSPVNRLSSEVLQDFSRALDYFDQKLPAGLIIHSSKDAGFIAGADIDEFSGLDTPQKVTELISRGWMLFNRLAKVPYPTLALVRGHCLGGGLELALACRYRLLVDDPGTSLSLPEVMLGIFPGWGGMQRLPALIGAPAALDMMLSGRPQDARKSLKLGLADGIVAPRLVNQAAKSLVLSAKPRRKARGLAAWLNHPWARPFVASQTVKKLDARDPHHHYPAPRVILQIWARDDGNALKAPELIDQLIRSDTARNLLRVFRLQERLKAFGKESRHRPAIKHVHVVGAGVMGGDIAAWCALKGFTVTLQDQDRGRIAVAQGRAHTLFNRKKKNWREARAAADRLLPDMSGDGIRRADLVIEAITEDAEIKRRLYAQIEPHLKPGAFIATNTSSLTLEELCGDMQDPARLIGMHFFNPVARMPLVEVVETATVNFDVKAATYAFLGQIDKLPLPVQSVPGFLVNAVLAPYMLAAMRCIDEGIKPQTIDAAMLAFGMPIGPIELIDTVGLDIVRDAGRHLSGSAATPACLELHLARNELGRKSGQGFYQWKNDKPVKPPAGPVPPGLAERLIEPLIDKTREQLNRGVVADADLADAGVVFGTGFAPFTGGPLHYTPPHGRILTT
ncbi:enoyl-CoA hydratase [Candidimonas sp. SYP-B2681]|uniref:3-hydroxyacyl-CoA dehydrogenase NAD-binding domain-containing protein n=1 Tax=Candidimonas sp. SYP-B2681 TaxID=2497686 RepID=UPI000F86A4C5|nr:3-hydroxyacyl-CoA dehydrogenase NAD-binding domain-containing protein [Candidimonas sp. SYP-B2681]RTZ45342.1 enoyl-CoA hydratase [Candidimonas sp. SYP-B2681]